MCGAPNGKPAIKRPSGIAVIYTLRRFYIFMCRTTISHFSFLIQVRLLIVIKGQYAPRANLIPFSKSQHVYCRLLIFSIDRTPQGGVVYG